MKKIISCTLAIVLLISSIPANIFAQTDGQYSDIENSYAKTEIMKWSEIGILMGYGDGTFGPGDAIKETDLNLIFDRLLGKPQRKWSDSAILTREQAAQVIAEELGLEPIISPTSEYGDHDDITPAYRPYVYALKEAGVQQGDGTNYMPKHTFTREAIIKTLSNALSAVIDNDAELRSEARNDRNAR